MRRHRLIASTVLVASACATIPPTPAKVAPRALTPADAAPAGRALVLVDVTNANTTVRAEGASAPCQTPCVLTLSPGAHRLIFEYERDGRPRSDTASVSASERPQVYRRTVRETHVRSRAGRATAITLWALGQAAMLTALGLLAADDDDTVKAARRGLGYGGLGGFALAIPIGLLSVHRTRGAGVQFPWDAGGARPEAAREP